MGRWARMRITRLVEINRLCDLSIEYLPSWNGGQVRNVGERENSGLRTK